MSARLYFVLDGPSSDLGETLQVLKDTFGFAITPEFRATFQGNWFTCVVALAQPQTLDDVKAVVSTNIMVQ